MLRSPEGIDLKVAIVAPQIIPISDDISYGGIERVLYDLCVMLGEGPSVDYTLFACEGSKAPGGELVTTVPAGKLDDDWTNEEEWAAFEMYEYDIGKDFDFVHDCSHRGYPYKLPSKLPVLHTCMGIQTVHHALGKGMFY